MVKARLSETSQLEPSRDEPSVWLPKTADLIEVNFLGMDSARAGETYVFEDDSLPLLVFGNLSLLKPAPPISIGPLLIPVPRAAGLIIEKLMTDRSGEKGDRDLLVVLALLLGSSPRDLDEVERTYAGLTDEFRHLCRANLSLLSLLSPRSGMPDPRPHRQAVAALLERLERVEPAS